MTPNVPVWVSNWCARELGSLPVETLLTVSAMSDVVGVRLEDGRAVVVKRRRDESGRARSCVDVQLLVAEEGFPCARPLTSATAVDGMVIHGEEWRPGGEIMREDDAEAARRSAVLLADLMSRLAGVDVSMPPLPNVEWLRWDHDGPGLFPPNERHDARAASRTLPSLIDTTARRARARLLRARLPCIIGHADWEAQNIRWRGVEAHAVHDWDSLAWLPEAAIVGAASGAFASAEVPTLAPLPSSIGFLEEYERASGRRFNEEEREVAWAASLWPALHNARAEVLYEQQPLALIEVERQAEDRLARAGA